MAYTKKYNGSSWVTAPFKKWNGSSWVDAKVQKWNGSSWVQLYPDTAATTSQTLTSTSFNTYRSRWDNDSVAKQGVYSSYEAAHGYLGVNAGSITGSGSITSISSASFSGTRDGSGYYNNNQTLRFHRSNIAPGSNPKGTMSGQFNSTTGAPGSGGAMNNRAITINSEVLNWMNKVSSKPYLYIYSTSSSDYAGIKNKFTLQLNNFVYGAKTVSFEAKDKEALKITPGMYTQMIGKTPYHSMTIYNEEENMTLEEIIKRREDGIVLPIEKSSIIDVPEIKPWTREYKVTDTHFKIEVFNMQWDDEAQFSLDGEEWFTLYGLSAEDNYLTGKLPKDFNKYKDFIFVRVIDKKKEIVHTESIIEPLLYIPDQNGIILPGEELDLDNLLKQ